MDKKVYISVSTDPVKEYQGVVDYAKELQDKADFLHCDIMDGKFVEKITYNSQLVKNINQNSLIALDVHLMCEEPLSQIDDYLVAGANIITVHYEAFKDKRQLAEAIKKIKKGGALAGISLKPNTKLKELRVYLYNIDVVLVMSVNPGKSGQTFMPEILETIKELDRIRKENSFSFKIEVDGGVNDSNAKTIIEAGADILVSGSFVYNSADKAKAIKFLKEC